VIVEPNLGRCESAASVGDPAVNTESAQGEEDYYAAMDATCTPKEMVKDIVI